MFRKYSRTEVDSVVLRPGQFFEHVGDISRDGRLGDVELAGDGGELIDRVLKQVKVVRGVVGDQDVAVSGLR